jgi:hypothetical protein
MTFAALDMLPRERLDREQALMNRLVEQCPAGTDVDPRREVLSLFSALGEVGCLISSSQNRTPVEVQAIHASLCTILVVSARLARQCGVSLYSDDEWPDGCHTPIGGDGAIIRGLDPQHLLAELVEAAGWIATWLQSLTSLTFNTKIQTTAETWLVTEPVTELVARTWCLADGLDAREPLRALIQEQLLASAFQPSGSETRCLRTIEHCTDMHP